MTVTDALIYDMKDPYHYFRTHTIEGQKYLIAGSHDHKSGDGAIKEVNRVCTHTKCIVQWNNAEKSWDCPCHGPRFDCDGDVLTGPARVNLERISIRRTQAMNKIGKPLQKILGKKYEPDSLINKTIGRLDIAFKTDKSGNPISVFVGRAGPDGKINGDRFVRVTIKDEAGRVVKDHWEAKGRT